MKCFFAAVITITSLLNSGCKKQSSIQLLPNSPPVAKAGPDIFIALPENGFACKFLPFTRLSAQSSAALRLQKNPEQKSAVWRSANPYASTWQVHNFAPPPHSGFALSIQELCFPYLSLVYMAYAYIKSHLEKVTWKFRPQKILQRAQV